MRWVLAALAAMQLLLPQPPPDTSIDADGHAKSEHQIPAGHYCLSQRVYDENAKRGIKQAAGHPCGCTYTCHVDANGNVTETGGEKSTPCKAYCQVDGRKCTCHVEEPCDLSAGSARFDMNHRMVAMGAKR